MFTHWRLSSFYFFYFASLGTLLPYWSLYLDSLGFSAFQIGEIMAVILITKAIVPNLIGWIADHTGKSLSIIRLCSFLSASFFTLIFLDQSYYWVILVMVLFSSFWNSVLPQFEVITLNHIKDNTHLYSKIRIWGSIGFITTATLIGPVLDLINISILPIILTLLFALIWFSSLWVQECKTQHPIQHHTTLLNILKRPEVIAFIIVAFLSQVAHGPYYAIYSLFLKSHQYSQSIIGLLWTTGVIAEIIVFWVVYKYFKNIKLKLILVGSLLLASIRWFCIGSLIDYGWMIFLAQLLHAATFATFHLAAINLTHNFFSGKNQSRGQALYSSVSYGAGGAVGSMYGGYCWEQFGPEIAFYTAAIIALIAAMVAYIWITKET